MVKKKIIVTDVDGVLLNWEDAFQIWMQHQGYEKVKKHQFIYNAAEQFGLRKDEVKEANQRDLFQKDNENTDNGYYKVPKIID